VNPVVHSLSQRLSLRRPQVESLQILDRVCELVEPGKSTTVSDALPIIQAEFPRVTSFEEREFVSLCFALATGVGKTRLMGAFVSYLHLAHGVRHFFVLAPNLTIYNKLIQDFTPNTKKYVFQGIAAFAVNAPELITGDNYESGRGVREERRRQRSLNFQDRSAGDDPIHINIFNISKINSEVRGGRSPRVKRLQEYIGESYFDYLAGLDDLVLLMDESHRYRASAGVKAINELKPILGLELTATPQIESGGGKTKLFENVIYSYPLATALDDGFVKIPAVVTRENFKASNYDDAALEDLKLEDGIRVHEETKGQLAIYAQENGRPVVKPFMLVVAQNTAEADRLLEKLTGDAFLGGRYKGRVITVHSNQSREENDETVQQLLSVEDAANPTEIVIHVNMLKEGWDVTNLYTIVPLRAANSKKLVEQSVGRGLRLPYGRRTGVFAVDRLNIVSHDRFDEIVNAANDPNSIIRAQVVIGRDIPDKAQKTVQVESKLAAALTSFDSGAASAQSLFASDEERTAARDVLRVLENAPRALRTADLSRPEVQQEIVDRLRLEVSGSQGVLADGTGNVLDLAAVVKKTAGLIADLTIDIPRIIVVPKGNVTARYLDFDLDTSRWPRYAAVAKDIVIQHLTDHERYKLVSGDGIVAEKRLEDYLVFGLIDYDEISYDETAYLLYKLSGQAVAHLQSYLKPEEVENVLQYHRKAMVQLIHGQMEEHFEQTASEYEARVSPGFVTIQPQLVAVSADEAARDFRLGMEDKSEITGLLFQGFRKCLQTFCKYSSDPERVFSIVLEDDSEVKKWFRPTMRDINIYYKSGSVERKYQPDFIVESAAGKWICETKKASEMNDTEVLAKATAAALWCRHATEATGESWGYLLIPHDHVRMSMTFAGFVAGCRVN